MQKSPEAIIADMLGLKEHMVGNVSLSTDTNSVLFDENFDPKFVQGAGIQAYPVRCSEQRPKQTRSSNQQSQL